VGPEHEHAVALGEGDDLVAEAEVERRVRSRLEPVPEQVVLGEQDPGLAREQLGVLLVLQLPGGRRGAVGDAAPGGLPVERCPPAARGRAAGGRQGGAGHPGRGQAGRAEQEGTSGQDGGFAGFAHLSVLR
jgi:hypothetical protein